MSRLILSCMATIVVLLSSCVPPTQTPDIQQPGQTGTSTVPPVIEEPPLSANPPSMSFIHGCYVHGRRIGDINQLRQSRLDQFNILYLIAGPDWKPTDFDLSSSEAIQKLVTNHTYPAGQSGIAMAPELLRRAHKSGVKTLLSIQDGEFLPLAQNPHRRTCFARVMTAFVKKYGFDGIEIDWESDFDLPLHAALMADIRKTLHEQSRSTSRYYYLATALMAGKKYSADLAGRLSRSVDWINIMTYDIGGGTWGTTPSHNTPLNRIKELMNNWSVFPPGKVCIGLANYGYYYQGIQPGQKSSVPLRSIGRSIYHNQMAALLAAGWTESFDNKAFAPYYFSPDRRDFVSIDNTVSLDHKMWWISQRGYRGVFWWEFHCDLVPAAPGQRYAEHPLIDHVETKIRGYSR